MRGIAALRLLSSSQGRAPARCRLAFPSLRLALAPFDPFRSNEKADERDRTSDPRFTKALLYQLSYIGIASPLGADISGMFSLSTVNCLLFTVN